MFDNVSRRTLRLAILFCVVLAGGLTAQLVVPIARGEERREPLIYGAARERLISSTRKSCISTASKHVTDPKRALKKKLIAERCDCYAVEFASRVTTKDALDFDGEISPTMHAKLKAAAETCEPELPQ